MISTASFDGHVTMYSLLGGGVSAHEEPAEQVGDNIFRFVSGPPMYIEDWATFHLVFFTAHSSYSQGIQDGWLARPSPPLAC